MTATDQLRTVIRDLEAKAKEMEIDKKLATFADQADHYLRVAATRAGEYAAENRERVEATLDKAGARVDEKTDGKYHAYVGKVRAGVLLGVDWVAEQRETAGPSDATSSRVAGASDADTSAATSAAGDAADVVPPGSADSEAWVDVTDVPPATDDPTPRRTPPTRGDAVTRR